MMGCIGRLVSVSMAVAGVVAADVTIDASTVKAPPPAMRVAAGVTTCAVNGRQVFRLGSDGGIVLPMEGHLTAESGSVEATFRLPETWPADLRTTLFHAGKKEHVHVTLFLNADGHLVFVYKTGKENYKSIQYPMSNTWEPGSWHQVACSWGTVAGQFHFWLRSDGKLHALRRAETIESWPTECCVGERNGTGVWPGDIECVRLASSPPPLPEMATGEHAIRVDANERLGPCYNFWSVSNFTSQSVFADPEKAAKRRMVNPFMKYVNCVRLLGGRDDGRNEWFRGIGEDGALECDFDGLVSYLRGMLGAGYTPRIVLDNVPTAMSEAETLHTYGNTYPPKDPKVWHAYVEKAVRAMVEAFGPEEVGSWRFRVGTEPDLYPGHWAGTKEEYLTHYDYTVDAVTRVIPNADIGPGNILNPSNAGANEMSGREHWGLEIVDHAAEGTNHCTGKKGTRLTFLQCSWYGRVGAGIDSFDVAIRRMRERLDRYPQFRPVPVDVAEFAILQDDAGIRLYCGDITEWGASWYAAIADRVYALGVEQVHEWAQTTGWILHPRALVIEMLAKMVAGDRLPVTTTGTSAARCGAIAVRKGDDLLVLLYNHRPLRRPNVEEEIRLTIADSRMQTGAAWTVSEWLIDEGHGVFAYELYRDCEAAGLTPLPRSPIYGGNVALRFGPQANSILRKNRKRYLELAQPDVVRNAEELPVGDGNVVLQRTMPGHSVCLLKLSPVAPGVPAQ